MSQCLKINALEILYKIKNSKIKNWLKLDLSLHLS